jgi:hypothetical protein
MSASSVLAANPREENIMSNRSSAATAAFAMALLGFAPAAVAGGAEKIVYTFGSDAGDNPSGGLVGDSLGNLYGTVEFTGADGFGLVYELSPKAKGGWTYSVIYTFTGASDGAFPEGLLTFDSAGNLYGTTVGGGPHGQPSLGAVFELSPDQNGHWAIVRTYSFTNGVDGSAPRSGVVLDEAGNAYGTSSQGAAGYGAIFQLTPSGDASWRETTIHQFTYGADGGYPTTGLTLDRKNNVYGSVQYGGTNNTGYVFAFHPSKKGWSETVLHNFGDGDAGGTSYAPLVLGKNGDLYGTTGLFDFAQRQWTGSVFELDKPVQGDQNWPVTTIYPFTGGADGGEATGLVFDRQGDIYVNLATGGAYAYGAIDKLTPSVNNGRTVWTESNLYDFTGGADGCSPGSNIVFDEPVSSRVYGVTASCGADHNGVAFAVKR